MSIGPLSKPYLLVPMVAAAQIINVALPGDEPDPSREIPENMTLYDDTLVDQKGTIILLRHPPTPPHQLPSIIGAPEVRNIPGQLMLISSFLPPSLLRGSRICDEAVLMV
jgi:hypothetical protein